MNVSPPTQANSRIARFAALIAIVAVALSVRLFALDHSLWLDELHTSWTVDGAWSDVAPRARTGNQGLPYFYGMRAIVQAFGLSEPVLRLPSVVAGTLVVLAVFSLVRRLGGSFAAAWSAAIVVALDRELIFYSQDARPYAVLHLAAVLQVTAFVCVLRKPTHTRRGICIALSLFICHLHYTAGLLLVGEGLCLCAARLLANRQRCPLPYQPHTAVVDAVILLVLLLPLIPHALDIAARRDNWEIFISRPELWSPLLIFPWLTWFVIPLSVALAVELTARQSRKPDFASRPTAPARGVGVLLGIIAATLTVAWLLAAGDIARLFYPRYLGALIPLAIAAAGLFGDLFAARRARLAYYLALIVAAAWSSQGAARCYADTGTFGHHERGDWRSAVHEILATDADARRPVFVRSGLIECDSTENHASPAGFCTMPVNNIYDLAEGGRRVESLKTSQPERLPPTQRALLVETGGGWFIIRGSGDYSRQIAAQLAESLIRTHTVRVDHEQTFTGRPGVSIFRLLIDNSSDAERLR